jgi:hypothetical protein
MVFRWQPWINRFSFLIVVFAAPLIGWLLQRWPPVMQALVAALLLVAGVGWVLLQPLRGLVGTEWLPVTPLTDSIPRYGSPLGQDRFDQLFAHHPPTALAYREALDYASALHPETLDVVQGGDAWEYPIWFWQQQEAPAVRIVHAAGGTNPTVRLCIGPCDVAGLTGVRRFVTVGPPSPSVDTGPVLTVGVVASAAD